MTSASSALDILRQCRAGAKASCRILVVVAHPDDEVIGVGARLHDWSDVHITCTTDGAPLDMRDAVAARAPTRGAYAALRRAERARALALAGVPAWRVHDLGFVDQQSSRELVALTALLVAVVRALRPSIIITHAYEGGHPDHDAAAFAVAAASAVLARELAPPALLELASYHAGAHGIRTGAFLPAPVPLDDAPLAPPLRDHKRSLLACFGSQRQTLQYFDCGAEPLRLAPSYLFGAPPHDGALFYEHFDWGMRGHEWRAMARSAARDLGVAHLA
ncbi:MAG TPA: PIG-L family deacetylase [Gemmatimonadaceae bacterium]|nr:PIG-L family deacetylase [Gemmatimonadaceae bacterium]